MKEWIEIGPCPYEEDAVQVMKGCDYEVPMKQQCLKFKKLLEEVHIDRPEGVEFIVKSNPHDFGTYYEVVVMYDTEDEDQVDYAYHVDGNPIAKWSDTTPIPYKEEE